jgi:hypothetical protein
VSEALVKSSSLRRVFKGPVDNHLRKASSRSVEAP